jgi:hypothetical protein
MDIVASTPAWKSLSSVSIEVRCVRSFTARLDESQAVLRPGESRAFTVTVRNTGNCEDNYLLGSGGALPAYFPRNLAGISGGSSEDFLVVVTAPAAMRSGMYDISVLVSSVSDPSIVRALTLKIMVEKITDLQVGIEERSGASPGSSGVFWLTATNLGSETETVLLSAPGFSVWKLDLPDLSVPPGQTVQAPVFYTVPEGIDGGNYTLSIIAGNGDRSWPLGLTVDVPASPVSTVSSGSSRPAPSLLPAILGAVVLIVAAAALALYFRSRRKNGQAAPADPQEVQSVQSTQPEQPVQPAQPEQSLQPAQPAQSFQPAQPEQPVQPAQPEQSLQSAQPAQSFQSAQPEQAFQSIQAPENPAVQAPSEAPHTWPRDAGLQQPPPPPPWYQPPSQ